MSIDRFLQQPIAIDAAFLERRNLERGNRNARVDILFAMRHPDDLVIEMTYTDASGVRTRRVVSPIRNAGKKFLALCLCRQRPQWFMFVQCTDVLLRLASDYLMPIEILTLPTVET